MIKAKVVLNTGFSIYFTGLPFDCLVLGNLLARRVGEAALSVPCRADLFSKLSKVLYLLPLYLRLSHCLPLQESDGVTERTIRQESTNQDCKHEVDTCSQRNEVVLNRGRSREYNTVTQSSVTQKKKKQTDTNRWKPVLKLQHRSFQIG